MEINNQNSNYYNEKLKINGKIDEPVIQSLVTEDCWFISGINALSSTEKGKEIIKNSIIPNPDGSVTVNFAGAGKSYTFTEDEILEYDNDYDQYDDFSIGDNDMLVLEMAMSKLREETGTEKVKNQINPLDWGNSQEAWNALTPHGSITDYDKNNTFEHIDEILKKALDNKNVGVCFSLGGNKISHKAVLSNGYLYEFPAFSTGHELSVLNITPNEITFNDPYDEINYTISWEEFKALNPSTISCIDLNT